MSNKRRDKLNDYAQHGYAVNLLLPAKGGVFMRLALGIAALLCSTAALAESNWVRIGTTGPSDAVEIDSSTIRTDGDYRLFWVRVVTSKETRILRIRLSCKGDTYAVISWIKRNTKGEVLNSSNGIDQNPVEEAIAPDSVAAGERDFVCSNLPLRSN